MKSSKSKKSSNTLLIEIAWEACNQVGGIYTVIRSKANAMIDKYGDNYCLLGPYFPEMASGEFEEIKDGKGPYAEAVHKLREFGFEAYYGTWLVQGRPNIVLINPFSIYHNLGEIKYLLWEHHNISTPGDDELMNQTLAFGYLTKIFLQEVISAKKESQQVLAHIHEWMAGTSIPEIRRENLDVGLIFTTHATLLGRYLAMNDPWFYDHLPFLDWKKEAKYFNVESTIELERAAAHGCHVFSTVSDVTAQECIQLLGRKPDIVVPNGLNIERFSVMHEVQMQHQTYKEQIHEFVMGHFFESYSFDLDKTLYFFTSGRYEYRNKGFDITMEALARLNHMMHQNGIDMNVVMFFITKRPYSSINPEVLQGKAVMEELRQTCEHITKQIGSQLFYNAAKSDQHTIPNLNEFIDDYWKLRYRRTLQSWKRDTLPPVITHNIYDDHEDELLNFIRTSGLVNNQHDKVKIVYHPDFINVTNPLFGMEYGQFVRGCHLGVFPSYYEPWGYTPLECIARGVPAVTSDLSGFGDYVLKTMKDPEEKGIYVINRTTQDYDAAAQQLAETLLNIVQISRKERIVQRNRVERTSEKFDWSSLRSYYDKAHSMAIKRLKNNGK